MPDISMCANEECPIKKNCYRHEAKPNPYRQTYGSFSALTEPDDSGVYCDYYWPLKEEEEEDTCTVTVTSQE